MNSSEDENAKYRANIEFIQASDWEKDLRVSLNELLDPNGQVSRECTNAESEAGIAYAKIMAVYPNKTKEMLAKSTVEELMDEPEVKSVLGTTKNVEKARPEPFYKALQHYVDSKEKSTDSKKKKEKGEKKQMEFWPLIKVVRIYTKADALSTGAVIVDLPGVHDSNAARAAVAAGYMKVRCPPMRTYLGSHTDPRDCYSNVPAYGLLLLSIEQLTTKPPNHYWEKVSNVN